MKEYVPLLVALVWPLTVGVLLLVYRRSVKSILFTLSLRLSRGDKVNLFNVLTVDSPDPTIPLRSDDSPVPGASTSVALSAVLGVTYDKRVTIALGEMDLGGRPSNLIGCGDALAMATVQGTLLRDSNVRITSTVVRRRYAHIPEFIASTFNLICIGGPVANVLTKSLLADSALTIVFRESQLFDRLEQQVYSPEVDYRKLTGTDYGILTSLPHPRGSGVRINILAGCGSYGTHGAARALGSIDDYPKLLAVSGGFFEALIQVPLKDGVLQRPSVLVARKLQFVDG